ncbi:hypothetical protein RHSIM_Rhsim10G0103500 [Rhododendron simsii]|uniref:Uncharacterized protein n=1 Tax=Rhododendron simsii TaxID=118357 RepID=A0A834LE42_RHOSS|nr:hypothetical protein RHSIM_Rhsim10G0103500 [Rhododendron simsii]
MQRYDYEMRDSKEGAEESLAIQINKGAVSKCRKCNLPSHNVKTCKFEVGQSSTSLEVSQSYTMHFILYFLFFDLYPIHLNSAKKDGTAKKYCKRIENRSKGSSKKGNKCCTTENVVTRGLAIAQRGVARGVASGRGQRGTIGAPRTVETDVSRGRGVARGLAVSATIGGASVVGTGGARTTRSTTFGGVRSVQASGARRDRDGATRIGETSGGAKTVEAGTMIRNGKKIYLKSHQSQQGWKIARIGDGVFSSQTIKGSTKGSTQ